jgi:hypothetical protein
MLPEAVVLELFNVLCGCRRDPVGVVVAVFVVRFLLRVQYSTVQY